MYTSLDYQATSKLNTYLQYSGELDRFNKLANNRSSNDAQNQKRYIL